MNRPAVLVSESQIPIQKRDGFLSSLHLCHHHLQFLSRLPGIPGLSLFDHKKILVQRNSVKKSCRSFERLNSPYLDYASGEGSPLGQLRLVVLVLKKILDFSLGSVWSNLHSLCLSYGEEAPLYRTRQKKISVIPGYAWYLFVPAIRRQKMMQRHVHSTWSSMIKHFRARWVYRRYLTQNGQNKLTTKEFWYF